MNDNDDRFECIVLAMLAGFMLGLIFMSCDVPEQSIDCHVTREGRL